MSKSFAAAWPEREIVQEALAQLAWYHNIALLDKLKAPEGGKIRVRHAKLQS